ncbi:hypothetical protein MKW98_011411 [Papaver atlanticum]|uniref:Uncharacterized protein n=1 Tax=Papaver atlanticum TaxID=357466 RepID=A0AAD4SJI2_9MAGN|nr:hypothetical protein MKW98_011411 [Papaver atlanticum]
MIKSIHLQWQGIYRFYDGLVFAGMVAFQIVHGLWLPMRRIVEQSVVGLNRKCKGGRMGSIHVTRGVCCFYAGGKTCIYCS